MGSGNMGYWVVLQVRMNGPIWPLEGSVTPTWANSASLGKVIYTVDMIVLLSIHIFLWIFKKLMDKDTTIAP